MTVNYSRQSSTATIANFTLLLIRWKGSLWKLIFIEALIWSALYGVIQTVYIFVLDGTDLGKHFLEFCKQARQIESSTLLTMLLGFFTSITINRWWAVYELMEWPDGIASMIATHLNQTDGIPQDLVLKTRRTCARYIMLSYIFLLRDISEPVKRRFPEYESLGQEMITSEELDAIKDMINKGHTTCKYTVPIHWMTATLKKLYYEHEGKKRKTMGSHEHETTAKHVINRHQYVQLIKEIFKFRGHLGDVLAYDWIPNPILAYTQICILAVYGYLLQQVISRQIPHETGYVWNSVITFFIALAENICYLGWFKAAQVMINPYGYDDEDFEVTWLIDRHWTVVKEILEEPWLDAKLPENVKNDGFININRLENVPLPHTAASAGELLIKPDRNPSVRGSVADLKVPLKNNDDQEIIYLPN